MKTRWRWERLATAVLVLALAGPAAAQSPLLEEAISVRLEAIATGLTAPVTLVAPPDETDRLFVVDQLGLIRILSDERLVERPFLDLRDRMVELMDDFDERGLLGLAFHPAYEANGRFFVYYSAPLREGAPSGWNHTAHISEFTVSETDPDRADPASERILLQVDQPQFNHDGGQIAFGDDGYLYIGLGDGGGANDVGLGHPAKGNGQDTTTLLGSILRIDVDSETPPYGIPTSNPFVGRPGRDEIYAYGLRNPYRMSFDRLGDGALYVGDVGQDLWEEVNVIVSGGNYGWNLREGTHCFDPERPGESPDSCPETGPEGEPLRSPVIEYGHPGEDSGIGLSVIGGFVYRGDAFPELVGGYLFGDWSASFGEPAGSLWFGEPTEGRALWPVRPLAVENRDEGNLDAYLLGFGTDREDEIYVLTSARSGPSGETGSIHKIVPPSPHSDASLDVTIDGVIGDGEYGNRVTVAGVDVSWTNDDKTLAIGLRSPGAGFVAIGFDPVSRMQGAAFVLGSVIDGRTVTRDDYGVSSTSHQADTGLGGRDDVIDAAGREGPDGTVIEFLFPLDSGDEWDNVISPGSRVPIIVSYHSTSDDFDTYHGFVHRGAGSITLESP